MGRGKAFVQIVSDNAAPSPSWSLLNNGQHIFKVFFLQLTNTFFIEIFVFAHRPDAHGVFNVRVFPVYLTERFKTF